MTEIAHPLCSSAHTIAGRPDFAWPDVVTHTYDPGRGPFRNLCDLDAAAAEAVLQSIRAAGLRSPSRHYLRRRLATEDWLIAESRRAIAGVRRARPIYFFLGRFDDGLDRARPASIVLPLALFPASAVTFTWPDSMTSQALATDPALRDRRRGHHGRVMTLDEVRQVAAREGLPARRYPRPPGSLSAGFIEMQLWDDAPLRAMREGT